jgi:uncharacterized protein (DUF2267 family)
MREAEFLDQVQVRADLPTTERAEEITTGVLETLGERLPFGEQDRLAAQLPTPLKELLHQRPRTDKRNTDRYPLGEFYQRVAARTDTSVREARSLSAVVVSVLMEAVSRGEIEDVIEELGGRYRTLFDQAQVILDSE